MTITIAVWILWALVGLAGLFVLALAALGITFIVMFWNVDWRWK